MQRMLPTHSDCRSLTVPRKARSAACRAALLLAVLLCLTACGGLPRGASRGALPAWTAPGHPFMAANGKSNVHNDAYMTDAYAVPGPAADKGGVIVGNMNNRLCVTIAFDRSGSIRTLCTGADSRRAFYLLDASTLAIRASFELPAGTDLGPAGAGYFYLDNLDRAVVPTTNKHVLRLTVTGDPPVFHVETDYDLTSLPGPVHIVSVLPDWKGRLWFATEEGLVGTLEEGAAPKTIVLQHKDGAAFVPEGIYNSFAVDETGGVYVVSDHALYRLDADERGNPIITWREGYDRGTRKKPGQMSWGSGTTPTLIGSDYVTITDNAEPRMNVLVYNRRQDAAGARLVCKVPVFRDGASATENSLIAFGSSIIVENNYGYTRPLTFVGKLSEPGIARIDLLPGGSCRTVWNANEVAPSVVAKYSSANGLVYTYTKDAEGWYLTALSGESGARVFRRKAGPDEPRFNNHYSGLAIGPDGAAYVGTIGGIIRFAP